MELNERYYSRFGLEYNPFIKNNSTKHYYESSDLKEAKYKLDYLFKTKGIGVITGNPGMGKTTTIRKYLNELNRALYKPIYICMTTLNDNDFYRQLIKELGYEPKFRKCDNFRLVQQIIKEYENKKITPVIVVDEANYLSRTILNDLKMILNFNMDSFDNYILILMGLPVLVSNLQGAAHEPFRQRIITSYNFEGLTNDETREYIYSKLEKAGGSTNIFDEGVIKAICNSSSNTPRVIDRTMDYALLIADKLNSSIITKEVIQKAIEQTIL